MSPHQSPTAWELLLAELAAGAGLAHLLDGWPPALVGMLSALVVGVSLRLFDPLLRAHGERFTGRLADERVYTTTKDAAWWAEVYARGVGSYEGQ